MCGRYALTETPDIDVRFLAEFVETGWLNPRYNIAPSQDVAAVTNEGARRIERMRWGLIPFWAKDPRIGYRMINARAETVARTPAFRASFKSKRCLIPADGFYEWKRNGKARTPFFFRLTNGGVFAFAGLYDRWRDPDGSLVSSCSIITTEPNELAAPVHDRMPVILPYEAEAAWLNLEVEGPGELLPLLKPFPAASMQAYRVSSLVNSAKNDTPECVAPAEPGHLPGM